MTLNQPILQNQHLRARYDFMSLLRPTFLKLKAISLQRRTLSAVNVISDTKLILIRIEKHPDES